MLDARGARSRSAILEHACHVLGSALGKIGQASQLRITTRYDLLPPSLAGSCCSPASRLPPVSQSLPTSLPPSMSSKCDGHAEIGNDQ